MAATVKKPLKLFYCYARKDQALREELAIHLTIFKWEHLITAWYDGQIIPGEEWEKEIDNQLQNADLILLLITPDFIASEYCYGTEMERALQRHYKGIARVIPIILRHCSWKNTPFSSFQVLPTNAKPIKQWLDRDEAFLNITDGIRQAINELHTLLKTTQEWLDEGLTLSELKRYEEALLAYERSLHLDPQFAPAWHGKGDTLYFLKKYEEALLAYEQALGIDPNAYVWQCKGLTLFALKRYEEALPAYERSLHINPQSASAWRGKSNALYALKRYEEAKQARKKADQFGSTQ